MIRLLFGHKNLHAIFMIRYGLSLRVFSKLVVVNQRRQNYFIEYRVT